MNGIELYRRAEFYSDLVPLTNAITATPADVGSYNDKATKTSSIAMITFASEINNDFTEHALSYPDSSIVTDSVTSMYDIVATSPTPIKVIQSSEPVPSLKSNSMKLIPFTKKSYLLWGIIYTSILISLI